LIDKEWLRNGKKIKDRQSPRVITFPPQGEGEGGGGRGEEEEQEEEQEAEKGREKKVPSRSFPAVIAKTAIPTMQHGRYCMNCYTNAAKSTSNPPVQYAHHALTNWLHDTHLVICPP